MTTIEAISEELVNQLAQIEIEYGYILPSEFTDRMLGNIEKLYIAAKRKESGLAHEIKSRVTEQGGMVLVGEMVAFAQLAQTQNALKRLHDVVIKSRSWAGGPFHRLEMDGAMEEAEKWF